MKVFLSCRECAENYGKYHLKHNNENLYYLPLNNDNIYEFECNYKHKVSIIDNRFKYQQIYESGINAFLEGYLSEATASFYSSLENFYVESCYLLMYKMNPNHVYEDGEIFIRKTNRLSERVLGCYNTLYYMTIGEKPSLFDEKMVSFRNKILHGSYYPTKEEVLIFGEKIKYFIAGTIETIENKFPNAYEEFIKKIFEVKSKKRKFNDIKAEIFNEVTFMTYIKNKQMADILFIKDYKPSWQFMKKFEAKIN